MSLGDSMKFIEGSDLGQLDCEEADSVVCKFQGLGGWAGYGEDWGKIWETLNSNTLCTGYGAEGLGRSWAILGFLVWELE